MSDNNNTIVPGNSVDLENIRDVLQYVQPLTAEQYEAAAKLAREKAIAQLREPIMPVVHAEMSLYPQWLNRSILGGVGTLLLAMFIVSTAKQLEAVNDFVSPVVDQSQMILKWVVMIAMIMGAEVGSLLFSVVAGVYKRYKFIFRVFSVLCATTAILANWHVTALHASEYSGIAVYAWYVTFLAPIVVIVVGMLLENIAMQSMSERAGLRNATKNAETEYQDKLREYRIQIDEIETTDLYQRRYLPAAIKVALETSHRQTRQVLIERPDVVRYAVKREILRYVFVYQEPEELPEPIAPKALPRVTPRNVISRQDTQLVTPVTLCQYCKKEAAKGNGRFCSTKCRVAAHRAKTAKGE
jgi:hypothetical protein